MNREEIIRALTALGEALQRRGVEGELCVVGGAAIALAYDERRSTRDIDAVFEPKTTVYEAAAEVGEQLALPVGWLNDAVKGFWPATSRRRPSSRCRACGAWPLHHGCCSQ